MDSSYLSGHPPTNVDYPAVEPSGGKWRARGKRIGRTTLNIGKGVLEAFIHGRRGRGAGGGPGGGDGGGCGDGGGGGGGGD